MYDVCIAKPTEVDETSALLMLAFAADPGIRAWFEAPSLYRSAFPAFAMAYGGRAFESGTADIEASGAGAALWLPPGVEQDSTSLGKVMLEQVPPESLARNLESARRLETLHPKEPHWYLAMLGVDPRHQGRGIGSSLLGHRLAKIDEEGAPAFLETTSPANLPLYERFGFEVIADVPNADDSVRTFAMLRAGR
jgi:ribosomal protein S18 acetylase RimI-like enzyme